MLTFGALCFLVSTVTASYRFEPQDAAVLNELQKRIALLDSNLGRDYSDWSPPFPIDSSDDFSRHLNNRDREYLLEPSANSDKFQYISGGAGEGKQHLKPEGTQDNVQVVKSDQGLPFYCHPPNPCPKGFTSKDGCQEFIEDSAEEQKYWIEQMQSRGMCTCDEEHMFDCPTSAKNSRAGQENSQLDDVISSLLENKENPWSKGEKRMSLVAKKSPIVKRDTNYRAIDHELDEMEKRMNKDNPYLVGHRIPTYAKKMSLTEN